MIHPLIRLLATRPHLLAAHLGGYAHLLRVQAGEALLLARARAVLVAGIVVGVSLGAGMAGVALMLAAAIPLADMPAPWLLAVAPAAPLTAAGVCGWLLRHQPPMVSMDALQAQLDADAALLREASD